MVEQVLILKAFLLVIPTVRIKDANNTVTIQSGQINLDNINIETPRNNKIPNIDFNSAGNIVFQGNVVAFQCNYFQETL